MGKQVDRIIKERNLQSLYVIIRFAIGLTLGLGLGTEIDSGRT